MLRRIKNVRRFFIISAGNQTPFGKMINNRDNSIHRSLFSHLLIVKTVKINDF